MPTNPKYKLFFLKQNSFFDEGTLFELADATVTEADNAGYYLPDRGDGVAGSIDRANVLECPTFAENIPPGNCPVKITSMRLLSRADASFDENMNNLFGVRIEQTLHYQKIVVPLPPDFPEIQTVILTNHLKNVEIDRYENPRLEEIDEGCAYCLHIGHIAPGFYDAEIGLPEEKYIRLRFIKFFPEYFKEKYPFIAANPPSEKGETFFIGEVGFRARDYLNKPLQTREMQNENGFSAELLNVALEIKTEWGENFRQPIDERLLRRFPALERSEIAQLDKIAGETESFICNLAERELDGRITETDIIIEARRKIPWINDENLFRLKNIAMYWARK